MTNITPPTPEDQPFGLRTFDFHGSVVRIVMKDGEPWFVASDVAQTLGYARPADAIRKHCKGVAETKTPSEGGPQITKIIREGDLYRLVIKSKLPSAQEFECKVMDEILPSIRKTGAYVSPEVASLPAEQLARQVVQAAGLQAPETWKQDLAHKIEQTRGCSKGAYELTKGKVVPLLERLEAKLEARPIAILGDMNPNQATKMLYAITKATANPRAFAAAKRMFPDLFRDGQPEQSPLPGMEGAL